MGELDSICNFRRLSPLLTTAGQPTEPQLRLVAGSGTEVVVKLGLTGTDHALADERGTVAVLGVSDVHIPVRWGAPSDSDLEELFGALRHHQGKRVFVHCAKNMRVSVFMAPYRVLEQGWTPAAALASVRSVWEPNAVWHAYFWRQLQRYGAR